MLLTLTEPWVVDDGGRSEPSAGTGWVSQVGVVLAVDRNKGELTMVPLGGTPCRLTAHPSLLQGVRQWGTVQAFTEGTVIRGLRCL